MAGPDELLSRLTDDAPRVRLEAVIDAGVPGQGSAPAVLVDALVRRLSDSHPGVMQAALEALTRLVDAKCAAVGPAALDRAIALATHDSALVRAEAVGALGVFCPHVDSAQRTERLLAALDDPEPEVRRTAAAAAGDLQLQEAHTKLRAALDTPETRFEAAFALASLQDAHARPTLEAALKRKRTRLDALEALRRLGDPAAAQAVRELTDAWLTPWVDRLSALATLYVLGDASAGTTLLQHASSRRMEERVYALFLLGRYDVSAGRDLVARIAQDRRHPQRETALDALGRYGDPDARDVLARIADDENEDDDTRAAASRALSEDDAAAHNG